MQAASHRNLNVIAIAAAAEAAKADHKTLFTVFLIQYIHNVFDFHE